MITIDLPPDVQAALDKLSDAYYAKLTAETYRHEEALAQIQEDYKHDKLNLMKREAKHETS